MSNFGGSSTNIVAESVQTNSLRINNKIISTSGVSGSTVSLSGIATNAGNISTINTNITAINNALEALDIDSIAGLQGELDLKADDADVLKKTGNQAITGGTLSITSGNTASPQLYIVEQSSASSTYIMCLNDYYDADIRWIIDNNQGIINVRHQSGGTEEFIIKFSDVEKLKLNPSGRLDVKSILLTAQTLQNNCLEENTANNRLYYKGNKLLITGDAISEISGLQTALDGKAASSHTHTSSQISDFNSASVALIEANGGGIWTWNNTTKWIEPNGDLVDDTPLLSIGHIDSDVITANEFRTKTTFASFLNDVGETIGKVGKSLGTATTLNYLKVGAAAVAGLYITNATISTLNEASDLFGSDPPNSWNENQISNDAYTSRLYFAGTDIYDGDPVGSDSWADVVGNTLYWTAYVPKKWHEISTEYSHSAKLSMHLHNYSGSFTGSVKATNSDSDDFTILDTNNRLYNIGNSLYFHGSKYAKFSELADYVALSGSTMTGDLTTTGVVLSNITSPSTGLQRKTSDSRLYYDNNKLAYFSEISAFNGGTITGQLIIQNTGLTDPALHINETSNASGCTMRVESGYYSTQLNMGNDGSGNVLINSYRSGTDPVLLFQLNGTNKISLSNSLATFSTEISTGAIQGLSNVGTTTNRLYVNGSNKLCYNGEELSLITGTNFFSRYYTDGSGEQGTNNKVGFKDHLRIYDDPANNGDATSFKMSYNDTSGQMNMHIKSTNTMRMTTTATNIYNNLTVSGGCNVSSFFCTNAINTGYDWGNITDASIADAGSLKLYTGANTWGGYSTFIHQRLEYSTSRYVWSSWVGYDATEKDMLVWGVPSGNNAGTRKMSLAANGDLYVTGGYFAGSDSRIKKNIVPINDTDALDLIRGLNVYQYEYNDPAKGTGLQYGWLAQEVYSVLPAAVQLGSEEILDENDEYITITDFHKLDKGKLLPVLWSACQKLDVKVQDLESQMGTLTFTGSASDGMICEIVAGAMVPIDTPNYGCWSHVSKGDNTGYTRIGKILLINKNGNTVSKSTLITSYMGGYGQTQGDAYIQAHTVAKITEDVNFTSITDTVDLDGITYKWKLCDCIIVG